MTAVTISVVALARVTGPATCQRCGTAIVWAVTDRGVTISVDREPHPAGYLELFGELFPDGSPVELAADGSPLQRVREQPTDRPSTSPAWRSHVSTCPAAAGRTTRRGPIRK